MFSRPLITSLLVGHCHDAAVIRAKGDTTGDATWSDCRLPPLNGASRLQFNLVTTASR